MKLAIFDFDGTLYKKETFSLLMDHLKEHPTYGARYKGFYLSALLPYISYKAKIYPERKMKMQLMQRYLRAFTGLSAEELDEYFSEAAQKMKQDIHIDVAARMQAHKDDNYHIMIVSGAFTPLLQSFTADFPVDTIIGTEVPLQNGLFDRNKRIDHIHAERKTERIEQFIQNKEVDWENSAAYGDSYSDLSVLNLVGQPVAVCPDEKLRQVATANEWEIIE